MAKILLVAVSGISMTIPSRERRLLVGLRLGHDDGVLLPLPSGIWGWGPGSVVSGPVVPPVAVVGPHSGPTAVVGPSAVSAIVARPSGTIDAPGPGTLGLGLGHHGLW